MSAFALAGERAGANVPKFSPTQRRRRPRWRPFYNKKEEQSN